MQRRFLSDYVFKASSVRFIFVSLNTY